MADKENSLANLKQLYSPLQKKYKLPAFSELNDDFDVEKLQDKETDHLLRLMRMVVIEKIANVVRFLELLINPSEAPTQLFIFAMLKNVKSDTRKEIEAIYKELSKIELSSLGLDIVYSEKEEAAFISEVSRVWNIEKPKIKDITQKLGMTWGKEAVEKERGYLG